MDTTRLSCYKDLPRVLTTAQLAWTSDRVLVTYICVLMNEDVLVGYSLLWKADYLSSRVAFGSVFALFFGAGTITK